MKKLFIACSALLLISLYGCKKQYSCTCNTDYFSNGVFYGNGVSSFPYSKMKEDQAKSACAETQQAITTSNALYQTSESTSKTTCTLN